MDPNETTTEQADPSILEGMREESPDEIRESLGDADGPGTSFVIETSTERDAIADLQPRDEEPEEVDSGPSDEQIFFEEGYTADDERWLNENADAVAGLVEPESEAAVRQNVKAVKEARTRLDAEERQDRLEGQAGLAQALSLLEAGEVEEVEIAEVLRENRPELLADFVRAWAELDPETAGAYWQQTAEAEAERYDRARQRAAEEHEAEIVLAFDQAMAKHKLTERGFELVEQIVGLSPGAMSGIDTPARAIERVDELVRGAAEIQRASEELEIRRGIAAEANRTDMALGWADAEEIPEIDFEDRIRSGNVFRQTKPQTVGDLKRAMLKGQSGVEDFAAQHNPRPAPPDSVYSKRIAKLLAR
jgi:hypothetical protein